MATVTGTSTAFPGDTGVRPLSVSTIGTMLQSWGYCTGYFGKNNEVPDAEVNVSGPYDRWPTRSGFDKFYGYIAGEQSNFFPSVVDGTTFMGIPREEGYHFNHDVTSKAISWIQATRSLTPDRPFFAYYAQSASHPPHTPPADWLARDPYKGAFDDGWDKFRETTLAKQIELGIVPPGTRLAPNPDSVQRWDDLDDDAKKVFARQMEVYATLTEHADYEVGRLVDAIDELGELDNTLFLYIFGDNGGSIVGDLNGCFVEWSRLNEAPEDIPYLLSRLDEYGGPNSYPNYAVGWAMAGATPCTWGITMAHGGGTMAPLVVHWPKGFEAKGELRRQYHHVIDIVPTILECIGIPAPKSVNGVPQLPMPGVSMRYTVDDAEAADRHITQYNESIGNRSIYHDGWLAAVVHMVPWEHPPQRTSDYSQDKWELYNTREDFGLANDVADEYPEKLEFLKQLFVAEALKNNVFPLDDRAAERLNPAVAGRPDIMFGRTELTLYPGTPGLPEGSFINTKAVSYTIDAELDIPDGGAEGVVLSQAGQFGGWSLYVKDNKPKYTYNWLARESYEIESAETLPAGKVRLMFEFDYDGGGPHKGATGSITVNGKQVGSGRIEKTMGALYSLAAEKADIGHDSYSAVTTDYDPWENSFTGIIKKITVRHNDNQPVLTAIHFRMLRVQADTTDFGSNMDRQHKARGSSLIFIHRARIRAHRRMDSSVQLFRCCDNVRTRAGRARRRCSTSRSDLSSRR